MAEKLKKNQFQSDLMRNFKALRDSKAANVITNCEKVYRRKIEDLVEKIKQVDIDRQDIINDLVPSGLGNTSVVPSDFNAEKLYEKDIEFGKRERAARKELRIACDRYQHLFGPLRNVGEIKEVLPDVKIYEFEGEESNGTEE